MSEKIPVKASWCSHCRCPEIYRRGSPCPDHKGADELPADHSGPNAYTPSAWVLSVVGQLYSVYWPGEGKTLWRCDGYDPRHGFWMRNETTREQRNVSERAIGRTYHQE